MIGDESAPDSSEGETVDATLPTIMDPGGRRAHAANPKPQLQAGELVAGRYEVVTLVGVGGYGEVYEVIDRESPEVPVALKLHRIGQIRKRALDALRAEFALLASLAHPNLARVYDFSMSGTGYGFFTQELIRGTTLAGALDLTTPKGVELLAQVLRALDYLHARGIVHGDVKPSNILVDSERQRVVMLDFGVTRTLGESAEDLQGSPTYMAPELIQGWPLDGRADLYSLGVTLYRLLTGVFPFGGNTTKETFSAHLRGQFEPMRAAPPAVADWVHRLIARNPADRPASAREALVELGEVTGHPVPVDTQATVASHIQFAPFIPRGDILEELEALSTGRGVRVAFLEGDAGTGKSRLLHELRQRLQLDGARWIQLASTREAGTPVDTKLAVTFLDPNEVARLGDPERRSLARALPFLRRPRERLAEPLDPERAAHARRVLLGELVARACVRRDVPVVIAAEDIQWARPREQASLVDVLSAAHRSGANLLVVATARKNSVDATWARLRPRFFRCDEFSPEESEAFARSLLGGLEALEGTAFHARLKRSPASALWVQESLRLACDRGILRRSNRGFERNGPLSASALPVVLRERVAMLPAPARKVAAALATVGVDANLSDIADVSARSAKEVAVAIETLLRHGIASRVSVGRSLGFRMHDRFVDVILEATPARTLRATRRRAAKLGERQARDAPEGLMRAAELYAAAERHEDASRVLRRALKLAGREGRPDTGLLVLDQLRALGESFEEEDLLTEFDFAMRVGKTPRAEGALWQVERSSAAPQEAAWRRARLELREGEFAMARQRLQPHIESSQGSLRAELLLTLADVESADGNPVIARIAYDEAAHAAKNVKDARREARALLGRTQSEHRARDPRASDSALAASAAAIRAKDPALQADAKRHVGISLLQSGDLAAAQRAFRSALKAARNAGNIAAEADALYELGRVARLRGQVADAVTALRRSVRLKRSAGLTHSARLPLVHLAALVRATGEPGLAGDLISVMTDDTDDAVRVFTGVVEGDLAVLRNEWRSALRHYSGSVEVSRRAESTHADARARHGAFRARLAEGHQRDEEPSIERLEDTPEAERSRLIAQALWLRDRDPVAALSAAKKAEQIRKPSGLFSTLFGSHLEAQWVHVLAQHWAGKNHAADLRKVQRRLDKLQRKYEGDAPRLMNASPLYNAIRDGRIDTPPGRIW